MKLFATFGSTPKTALSFHPFFVETNQLTILTLNICHKFLSFLRLRILRLPKMRSLPCFLESTCVWLQSQKALLFCWYFSVCRHFLHHVVTFFPSTFFRFKCGTLGYQSTGEDSAKCLYSYSNANFQWTYITKLTLLRLQRTSSDNDNVSKLKADFTNGRENVRFFSTSGLLANKNK